MFPITFASARYALLPYSMITAAFLLAGCAPTSETQVPQNMSRAASEAGAISRLRITGGNYRPLQTYLLGVVRSGLGEGTITSSPIGIDCGVACNAQFASGNVVLTAMAATGSTFSGWSGACAGAGLTCAVTLDEAKTVTASFTPLVKVLSAAPTGVDVRTKTPIVFYFNQDMDRASVQEAFASTPEISCAWTWKEVVVGKVWSATCQPKTELSAMAYSVKLKNTAKDKTGSSLLIDTLLSFTTETPQTLFDSGTTYGDRREIVPGEFATPAGAFRSGCFVSHFAKDDPIVFPGQPGASHLHMFLGNTAIDAYTTSEILASSGRSTCNGGVLNRTAYWMPALLDKDNNVIRPDVKGTGTKLSPRQNVYYKTGSLKFSDSSGALIVFPAGLKMISGAATATPTDPQDVASFGCLGTKARANYIPPCPQGSEIVAEIPFPNCWDGVNLDSAKHNTHVAFDVYNNKTKRYACPATHPYPMPGLALILTFAVPDSTGTDGWHLSSDNYVIDTEANRGGYSLHADWMNGWNQDEVPIPDLGPTVKKSTLQIWVDHCVNALQDCADGGMGALILDGIDGKSDWGYALVGPENVGSGKVKTSPADSYGSFGLGFDAMCGPKRRSPPPDMPTTRRGTLQ